ncbi:MAG: sodium:calcium antiporter [Nanoarchaeota archaeon]|nr:sodium:calcium antiporter [Nanoarchaeota archaeon]
MIVELTLMVAGLILLWLGSGFVVDAAKRIAAALKISPMLIGLTIISIGTSLPEIMTNVISGIKVRAGIDASGVAIGTNIGSCLTQITLILGIAALISRLKVRKSFIRRDGIMILFAILSLFMVGIDGTISRMEGATLIVIYLTYLIMISQAEDVRGKVMGEFKASIGSRSKRAAHLKTVGIMLLGIVALIFASNLVVNNAIRLAEEWNVAKSFVGVLIIGVGTGLPELSTAIRAAMKRSTSLSVGVLVGSNITDPLLSLGSGAVISGFTMNRGLLLFDLPYWFFASALALLLLRKKTSIRRPQAIALIAAYVLFVVLKIGFFR